jgi:SAM-dependent methyltransferase
VSTLRKTYIPDQYWEERLTANFNLEGVGYGTLGPNYNHLLYRARAISLKRALGHVDYSVEGKHVLEVGCGTGFYTDIFCKDQVTAYTGVDITHISTQQLAERYPSYRFIRGDISDEVSPVEGEFDLVFIADVLFHITDQRRFQNSVCNLCQAVKPGGMLIISDVFPSIKVQQSEHVVLWSYQEFEQIFFKNGIKIEWMEPIFSILSPPIKMAAAPLLWRGYYRLWIHLLLRLAHTDWFDNKLSRFLFNMDQKYFLRRAGKDTPNIKWLIARKSNVDQAV